LTKITVLVVDAFLDIFLTFTMLWCRQRNKNDIGFLVKDWRIILKRRLHV